MIYSCQNSRESTECPDILKKIWWSQLPYNSHSVDRNSTVDLMCSRTQWLCLITGPGTVLSAFSRHFINIKGRGKGRKGEREEEQKGGRERGRGEEGKRREKGGGKGRKEGKRRERANWVYGFPFFTIYFLKNKIYSNGMPVALFLRSLCPQHHFKHWFQNLDR